MLLKIENFLNINIDIYCIKKITNNKEIAP